jgi:hypothetical protein
MARASFFSKACRCRSGDCRNLRRRKHFRSWNIVLPWPFESARLQTTGKTSEKADDRYDSRYMGLGAYFGYFVR